MTDNSGGPGGSVKTRKIGFPTDEIPFEHFPHDVHQPSKPPGIHSSHYDRRRTPHADGDLPKDRSPGKPREPTDLGCFLVRMESLRWTVLTSDKSHSNWHQSH
jgi:hypothetical protein